MYLCMIYIYIYMYVHVCICVCVCVRARAQYPHVHCTEHAVTTLPYRINCITRTVDTNTRICALLCTGDALAVSIKRQGIKRVGTWSWPLNVRLVPRSRMRAVILSLSQMHSWRTRDKCNTNWRIRNVNHLYPYLNPSRIKRNVFYLKTQSVPRSKHTPSQLQKPIS